MGRYENVKRQNKRNNRDVKYLFSLIIFLFLLSNQYVFAKENTWDKENLLSSNDIKIYKQTLNNTFTEKSDYIENSTGGNHSVVWIRVQDIDNNGKIDLIENDKGHFNSEEYSWPNVSGNTPLRWEWDGSTFKKIT